MTQFDLYQIDAFTDQVFKGNPAAVVPMQSWPPDSVLQAITEENNLSETAFFVPDGDGFELRWFMTSGEIDLCGHATLASAYVIFNHLNYAGDRIRFATRKAGDLFVTRERELLTLDFPVREPVPVTDYPPELIASLGGKQPAEVLLSRDYLVVYEREEDVCSIVPDFTIMQKVGRFVCPTAPGNKPFDFVSRNFCPNDAMPEDPVTGSTHCSLIPYWSKRFGKTDMLAAQLSKRGGILHCRIDGERVYISGTACTYLVGKITI